eukprot:scaffold9175_cov57-Phaeocystis_antarctica.AAC.2
MRCLSQLRLPHHKKSGITKYALSLTDRLHLLGARVWAGVQRATELGGALVRAKVEQAPSVFDHRACRLLGEAPATVRVEFAGGHWSRVE